MSGRPTGESTVNQIQILYHLSKSDLTQKQLSQLTGLSISAISKHLKLLENNGLIKKYKTNIFYYEIDKTTFNFNYFEQIGLNVIEYSKFKIDQVYENVKHSREKTKKVFDSTIKQIEEYRDNLLEYSEEITELSISGSEDGIFKYAKEYRWVTEQMRKSGLRPQSQYKIQKKSNIYDELEKYVEKVLANVDDSKLTVKEKLLYALRIKKIMNSLKS